MRRRSQPAVQHQLDGVTESADWGWDDPEDFSAPPRVRGPGTGTRSAAPGRRGRARPRRAAAPRSSAPRRAASAAAAAPPGRARPARAPRPRCARTLRASSSARAGLHLRRPRRRGAPAPAVRTRFTITPPNGSRPRRRRLVEEDRLVDRVLARRGDQQEGAAVVGQQRVHLAAARSRKPSDHAAEAAEELRQVLEQVHAGGALHAPRTARRCRGPAASGRARPGPEDSWSERESMNAASLRGASRKSSALRVGGVSSTSRSYSPSWWSSWSFSIAMYSCEPATAFDSSR